jgi:hypothetical protein
LDIASVVLAGTARIRSRKRAARAGATDVAVRHATAGMDIPIEHRVLFYHTYERAVVSQVGTFYAALNAFLVEHRILRHLRIYVPLPTRSGNAGHGEGTAPPVVGRAAGAGVPRQGCTGATVVRRGIDADAGALPAAGTGCRRGDCQRSGSQAPAPGGGASGGVSDAELFSTLRELLASRRQERWRARRRGNVPAAMWRAPTRSSRC